MTSPHQPESTEPVSRREFVAALGWLALAGRTASIGAGEKIAHRHGRALGIQLYTLRDLLARDLEGTLARVAAIGYREVELAGFYNHSAPSIREVLDRHGLRAPAGHVDLPAITDQVDRTISDAQALGHRYVILPWLAEEFRTCDGYARIAEQLNQAGERFRTAGLVLGYHNHDFEFAELPGGEIGYDILLRRTDPGLVVMELDLFWIRKGGGDAMKYFHNQPDRFRLVHIKDMAADGTMMDVGSGVIVWGDLLTSARRAGVEHFLVEHDQPADPLASALISYRYLRSLRL